MMRHGAAAASFEQQASSLRELVGSDENMALVVAMLGPCGARSCAEALRLARMVPGVRFWGDDVRLLPTTADWTSILRASFGAKLQGFEAVPRDWITQAVRDWYEQEEWSRHMLLVGEAGTGKSVVAATLALHESDSVVVGAAHCFDAADANSCDLRKAYASIAAQLAATVPDLAFAMDDAREDTLWMDVKSQDSASHLELFQHLIAKPCYMVTPPQHRVVIVLDGVDECSDSGRGDLLYLLESSFKAYCPDWLGFLVTSRPRPQGAEPRVGAGEKLRDFVGDVRITWRQDRVEGFGRNDFALTVLELDERRSRDDVGRELEAVLAPVVAGTDLAAGASTLAKRCSGSFLHARFASANIARGGAAALVSGSASGSASMSDVYAEEFGRFKAQVLGGSGELYSRVFAPLVAAQSPVPLSLLGEPARMHVRRANDLLVVGADGRVRFVHHKSMAKWLVSNHDDLAITVDAGHANLADLCVAKPTNRFALRYALFHLCKDGREQEVADRLLDIAWLLAALQIPDVDAVDLVVDAGPYLDGRPEWREAAGVLRVLEEGTEALRNDPLELASQLYGRLEADHAALTGVDEHYAALGVSWLKPMRPSLGLVRGPLRRRRFDRVDYVQALDYCHELDMIVCGSRELQCGTRCTVWRASTGQLLRTIPQLLADECNVTVAPSVDMIVCGGWSSMVYVGKASTGELLRMLKGHSASVNSVAVDAAELDMIVSGSDDKTVKVWKASTGELLRTLEGHSEGVWSVAVAAKLDMIVSGSKDATVKVWKASTGELLRTLEGHSTYVKSLVVAAKLDIVVSGSWDKTVKVWQASTGELLRTLEGHSEGVWSVAVAAKLDMIVSGSKDATVKVWKASTGELLETVALNGYGNVAVATEAGIIVSGCGGYIHVWELPPNDDGPQQTMMAAPQQTMVAGHRERVNCVAVAAELDIVVSGSEDKTVKVWKLSTGELLRTLEGHSRRVTSVAVAAELDMIVSGSSEIKVWQASTGELLRTVVGHLLDGHTYMVNSIAVSAELDMIVTGGGDSTVKVWNASTGELLLTLGGYPADVTSVAVSAELDMIVGGGGEGMVKVWRASTGEVLRTLGSGSWSGTSVAVVADLDVLVVGAETTLDLWRASTGDVLERSDVFKRKMAVQAGIELLASRDTEYDTLHFWDVAAGQFVARSGRAQRAGSRRLANRARDFSPDSMVRCRASQAGFVALGDCEGIVHILKQV